MTSFKSLLKLSTVAILAGMFTAGCVSYSFTGVTIPPEVRTIYIPFFPDNSSSGLGNLSDELNEALIERFVNQSRLRLISDRDAADAILDGTIVGYRNRPFSVAGDERATLNRVEISVRATFKYRTEDRPEWDKSFNGVFEYDPREDPIDGERDAVTEAMSRIASNMFNDALSSW